MSELPELPYEEILARTERALRIRIDLARELSPGSAEHDAHLGTCQGILNRFLVYSDVPPEDKARLQRMIDVERG